LEHTHDSFPIEIDPDTNRISDDSRAAKALEGLPNVANMKNCGKVSAGLDCDVLHKTLLAYERQYQDAKADYVGIETAGFFGAIMRAVAWFVGAKTKRLPPVCEVLRAMIADLTNAHAAMIANYRAAEVQTETMQQIHQVHGDHAKLRAFLFANFEADLQRADAMNLPLLEVCKEIMMRSKS
jgi:hypothetical protein